MIVSIQQHFETHFGPEFGHGKSFELARLLLALAALGAPHEHAPPVIHVAGTNGKGSTIAFMRAIAEAAGLRVHAFTKPHLLELNERFCVAGKNAGDGALIAAAERVARIAPDLTQFEAQVACAFLLFAETPADLCLIETGMGGRDDATNVLASPAACVLTPIALDHQDVLGATVAKIAAHKAGILKPGAPAIVARQLEEVSAIIESRAAKIGARLLRQGVEWDACADGGRMVVQTETCVLDLPLPALAGAHQIDNAGLAAATLLFAGAADIADDHVAIGIANARWPGRLQPITCGPLAQTAFAAGAELWIDGGHNAHAAQALARALADMNRKRPAQTALILGMRVRKGWRAFLDHIAVAADHIIAIPLIEEAAAPEVIAAYARINGLRVDTAPGIADALQHALKHGAKRVLICGSLLLAAETLAISGR